MDENENEIGNSIISFIEPIVKKYFKEKVPLIYIKSYLLGQIIILFLILILLSIILYYIHKFCKYEIQRQTN